MKETKLFLHFLEDKSKDATQKTSNHTHIAKLKLIRREIKAGSSFTMTKILLRKSNVGCQTNKITVHNCDSPKTAS